MLTIRDRLDKLGVSRAEMARSRAAWDDELDGASRDAIAAGVPMMEIAERTGISRAWLYRRFGCR